MSRDSPRQGEGRRPWKGGLQNPNGPDGSESRPYRQAPQESKSGIFTSETHPNPKNGHFQAVFGVFDLEKASEGIWGAIWGSPGKFKFQDLVPIHFSRQGREGRQEAYARPKASWRTMPLAGQAWRSLREEFFGAVVRSGRVSPRI